MARQQYDFYLIAHEHLYVFRKPEKGESKTTSFRKKEWWTYQLPNGILAHYLTVAPSF